MNFLTWSIRKETQILKGCETFAFKYTRKIIFANSLHPDPDKMSDLMDPDFLTQIVLLKEFFERKRFKF